MRSKWVPPISLALPYLGVFAVACVAECVATLAAGAMGDGGRWAVRVSALPLIAAFQNHLQILQHEGAHFHLARRRALNDWLANTLCSIPFFGLIRHYRMFHFQHHRHLLDPERDPEISFYAEQGYRFEGLTPWAAARMLAKDLSGWHYAQFFWSYHRYLWSETRAGKLAPLTRAEWGQIGVVVGVIACLGAWAGPRALGLVAFYWLAPQPTWMFFFLKLQGYGEHRARGATVEASTNDHELGWLARFFIYPYRSELHLTHHLNPRLPWYRLRPAISGRSIKAQNF